MPDFIITYTDNGFPHVDIERNIVTAAGGELRVCQCKTEEDVVENTRDSDALIVQWAPITRRVVEQLQGCKVIVRLGVGIDNVDIDAATEYGIKVCNVPDYCIDEVADHTMAFALSLGRQLPQIRERVRSGQWSIVPPAAMPAFNQMTFGTLGYGRIAKAVHARASAFGFRLAAHDPFSQNAGGEDVLFCGLEQLLRMSDILSLHCPLTDQTRHVINSSTLQMMKPGAIMVNTARGALVDTVALAEALDDNVIAAAGLDVFETEPLVEDHRLINNDKAILTSHVSWYSESSVPTLQRKAAEEAVRGCLDKPLASPLN